MRGRGSIMGGRGGRFANRTGKGEDMGEVVMMLLAGIGMVTVICVLGVGLLRVVDRVQRRRREIRTLVWDSDRRLWGPQEGREL